MRSIVLIAVFFGAVRAFGALEEGPGQDMTMSLGKATLPEVAFTFEGQDINVSPGYTAEMDKKSLGKNVTPLEAGEKVVFRVLPHGRKVKTFSYKIYTPDGRKKVTESRKNTLDKNQAGEIPVGNVLKGKKRAIVEITLKVGKKKKPVHYYTRIQDVRGDETASCLAYAIRLHKAMLSGNDKALIETSMEPDPLKSPGVLDHVTLYSTPQQAAYGDYSFTEEGSGRIELFETNASYTAIVITSHLEGTAPEGEPNAYRSREYFKIRTVKDKNFLVGFDRKLSQTDKNPADKLTTESLPLGVTEMAVEKKESPDGTQVAFLLGRDIYGYDRKDNELAKIFSFTNAENRDVRNENPRHSIRVMDVDNDGSVTFAVCGYMNRGPHEGKVGVSLCLYDRETNTVEEKAYIESRLFPDMVEENLGEFIYYSRQIDTLWMMVEGTFYRVDLKNNEQEILARGRKPSQYKVSADGHFMAYEPKNGLKDSKEIRVLNMQTGKAYTKKAEKGAFIAPLGFIDHDFIAGTGVTEDAGRDMLGRNIYPMQKLQIMDKNAVKKDYTAGEYLIRDITVKDNQIEIHRLYRKGDVYKDVSSDYITNNVKKSGSTKIEKHCDYSSMQFTRLMFNAPLKESRVKELSPQLMKNEHPNEVEIKAIMPKNRFFVYTNGALAGVEETAGQAIRLADAGQGLVTDSDGNVIWERGNRPLNYMVGEILEGKKKSGESDVACCVRLIAEKEGVPFDNAKKDLEEKPVETVLADLTHGEGLNLSGVTVEETFDIIRRGTPVIAMPSVNEAYLITGYADDHIIYINPKGDNTLQKMDTEEFDKIMEGAGRIFAGYRK